MPYGAVLWMHSWLRWLVVLVGLTLLARACLVATRRYSWTSGCDRLVRAFLAVVDTQMLFGLLLWVLLSPLSRAGFSDPSGAMSNPPIRFFTFEHPFGMLLAIAVAHAGLGRARRLDDTRRPAAVVATMVIWLLLTLASVPWPLLPYGRPLFRLG